ncbi:MAG: hypothetical protein ACOY16_08060 [Chloroflexota bacterium]
MDTLDHKSKTLDPIESLQECLVNAWMEMCRTFDTSSSLPDIQAIFAGVDLRDACVAAEQILVNLLLEIMESVSRFSPWYKQPPRAYGLTTYRDARTQRVTWILAPEAHQRWELVLNTLEQLLLNYRGIFQAVILVDGLMSRATPADPQVLASCQCDPPHTIQLKRSIVEQAEVVCDHCKQPYHLLA